MELRSLVSLRSRRSVRDRHLPELWSHLTDDDLSDPGQRMVALMALIDRSIAEMDDPAHRQAARALLGSGDQRWDALKVRGNEAASHFGCGWDAYRRRRPSVGSSQLDDTIDALAHAIRATTSRAVPADEPPPVVRIDGARSPERVPFPTGATEPSPPPVPLELDPPVAAAPHDPKRSERSGQRRRNELILVTVAIIGVLAVTVVAVTQIRSDDRTVALSPGPGEQPIDCGLLRSRPGDLPTSADEELHALTDAFVAAASEHPEIRCADVMQLSSDRRLVIQRVSQGAGAGTGAIVAAAPVEGADPSDSPVLVLTHNEFTLVRVQQTRSSEAQLGLPVARHRTPTHDLVEFTSAMFITEHVSGPTFVVAGPLLEAWLAEGGMDGPVGPPVDYPFEDAVRGRISAFAHADAVVDYVNGELRWEPVVEPANHLPVEHRGAVLTTPYGTSWLVDHHGRRHWIPDDRSYACAVGAQAAHPIPKVPAAAVATLEPGEPFQCL